jgi:CRISPR/Cas system-associated exonuclease Cas4 (RecB family)
MVSPENRRPEEAATAVMLNSAFQTWPGIPSTKVRAGKTGPEDAVGHIKIHDDWRYCMLTLALVAFTIGALYYLKLRRDRRKIGITSWVVDQDLDGRGVTVYRNNDLGLSCKPDVVERGKTVEYKSATIKGNARHGDVLYVAAQMLVVGKKEADLRYPNKSFTFRKDNPKMQRAMQSVRSIIGQMRKALQFRQSPRATPTPGKCRVCSFRNECQEAIR